MGGMLETMESTTIAVATLAATTPATLGPFVVAAAAVIPPAVIPPAVVHVDVTIVVDVRAGPPGAVHTTLVCPKLLQSTDRPWRSRAVAAWASGRRLAGLGPVGLRDNGDMRLYLDICCLKRPFDDQAQPRIRIETEAVLGLLAGDASQVTFVRSVAHDLENEQNPLAWRAQRVRAWLAERPLVDPKAVALRVRTAELMASGLRGFDALHLACAEAAVVDVFVTCDDRLLAAAQRLGSRINVRVGELTTVAREVL